jgi:hypothetical protein
MDAVSCPSLAKKNKDHAFSGTLSCLFAPDRLFIHSGEYHGPVLSNVQPVVAMETELPRKEALDSLMKTQVLKTTTGA